MACVTRVKTNAFVVITCHNEKLSVLRCLERFSASDPHVSVIVVDDGSTDETAFAVQEQFPNAIVLTGSGSLWWSGATNLGAREALKRGATAVVFLNNDCVIPPGGITALVAKAKDVPKSIVSAAIGDLADGSPVSFGGQFTKFGTEYIESLPNVDENGLATVDWLPGHAVVVPSSVFEEIGYCDEIHFPQYWGDADFFLRARRAGYRLCVMPSVMVLNDRSQTGIHIKIPIRPKNLWTVLTHQRSALRLSENIRFFIRHRDFLSTRQLVGRYEFIPIIAGTELLEKTGLRWIIRKVRRSHRH